MLRPLEIIIRLTLEHIKKEYTNRVLCSKASLIMISRGRNT